MKILCLLLIIANVSVFLWEYRQGGLSAKPDQPLTQATPGVDTILLANEVEKESALIPPKTDQAEQHTDIQQIPSQSNDKPLPNH